MINNTFFTGTTNYKPNRCFNGFTLIPARGHGALLIDMNGTPIHLWENLQGEPNKIMKGGKIFSSRGVRDKSVSHQDRIDLVKVNWDGEVEWSFDKLEFCDDPNIEPRYMLRQHHDYQIEGSSFGYYSPKSEIKEDFEKVLILCHKDVLKKKISSQILEDDILIEVNRNDEIVWKWNASDHFNEFGFSEIAKNAIYRNPNTVDSGLHGQGDWLHINTASYVGKNKWYAAGDMRFAPDNIIMDSREANIIFIIDHKTGKIVWKIGPDYTSDSALRIMGPIIGCHNAHIIPEGLPGAGNLLVFDNGGWAGYSLPDQVSKTGNYSTRRDYSRVLEINPVTLEVVWELNPSKLGFTTVFNAHYFYSPLVCNAQRLPNGNTMVTIGCDGRIIEVTADYEIVWDYTSPYYDNSGNNMIYRAYRVPYDYVPQATHSPEIEVTLPDCTKLNLENAIDNNIRESVSVNGTWEFGKKSSFCVEKL